MVQAFFQKQKQTKNTGNSEKLHLNNAPILFNQNVDPNRYLLALHYCLSYIRFDVLDATQKWETLDIKVFGPERKNRLW